MACKGDCIKYNANRVSARYKGGQKRCTSCEIFLKYDGLLCPCCGIRLRTGPRARHLKKKLRESEEVK